MTAAVRRAIAYIAARAATGYRTSSLYDYDAGKHVNFSGEVSDSGVSIYDFEASCHISGSRADGSFSLYHFGSGGHLQLTVEAGGEFSGYDYSSSGHFRGAVTGHSVNIYDYRTGQYFNYSF